MKLRIVFFCWVVITLVAGCATLQGPSAFNPGLINEVRFRDRETSSSDADVRVTVAVPTQQEILDLFHDDLLKKEIQPVWVKIENHSDVIYHLVSSAMDPNYFSPFEVVYTMQGRIFDFYQDMKQRYFRSMSFRNPVLPNTAVSGFIFTNFDEGEKVVQIDLIADQQFKSFTFFVQIPGMRVDYRMVDFNALYAEKEILDCNEIELKLALEALPCCTTNKDGTRYGDPANLVVIGHFKDIAAAFARRGWLPTEETYTTAVWKTIKSFLFGSRYRYAPVSPLYFFDRMQDLARQKPRRDIHKRNHLRLWYSPLRFQGKPVFIGQVSRDIGVRFTSKAWPPVTHKIDPDIDEARFALIEDLIFSQMLAKIGFIKGMEPVRPSNPRSNLTGDALYTDGYRAVLFIEPGPIAMDGVQSLTWEDLKSFHLRSSNELHQD